MGHKLSKEAAFIQDLKSSLRERGIRVKKKDLIAFFIFVSDVCPWLIIEGPDISSVSWDKVGRYLNDLLQEKGPNAIPIQVFSYWSIIRDVLRSPSDQKGRLISLAEDFIRPLSLVEAQSPLPNPWTEDLLVPQLPSTCPIPRRLFL